MLQTITVSRAAPEILTPPECASRLPKFVLVLDRRRARAPAPTSLRPDSQTAAPSPFDSAAANGSRPRSLLSPPRTNQSAPPSVRRFPAAKEPSTLPVLPLRRPA